MGFHTCLFFGINLLIFTVLVGLLYALLESFAIHLLLLLLFKHLSTSSFALFLGSHFACETSDLGAFECSLLCDSSCWGLFGRRGLLTLFYLNDSSSGSLSSLSFLGSLALLVLLVLELLACELLHLFLLSLLGVTLLLNILAVLLRSSGGALGLLNSESLTLLLLLLPNDGLLFLALSFNCSDSLLPLSLNGKLSLAVSLDGCELFRFLLLLFLLLLFLEYSFELFNGASVLLGDLLELGSVLLLLLALLCALVLVLFA